MHPWLLATVLGWPLACAPEGDARVQDVVWLSHREVTDVQVGPDGTVWVIGSTTADEGHTGVSFGQTTFRPWLAIIDRAEGLVEQEVGFLGRGRSIAVGAQGTAYALVDNSSYSGQCELSARDGDGAPRWATPWPGPDCPAWLLAAPEGVLGIFGDRIEALDDAGEPRWSLALEGATSRAHAWVDSHAHVLWIGSRSHGADGTPDRMWRVDTGDGRATHRDLGVDRWGSELARLRGQPSVAVELADPGAEWDPWQWPLRVVRHYDAHGRVLDTHSLPGLTGDGSERTQFQPVGAAVTDHGWLLAGTTSRRRDDGDRPDERLWLRTSSDISGVRDVELSFEDPDDLDDDATACTYSDVGPFHVVGTSVAVARDVGGALLVVGRQHCRHTWIGWVGIGGVAP
jgi:hypothetical protein